jgi:hypothetical protein
VACILALLEADLKQGITLDTVIYARYYPLFVVYWLIQEKADKSDKTVDYALFYS